MSGLDTTRAANNIRTIVAPTMNDAVFRNNRLFQHFLDGGESDGDTAYRWNVISAPNDSVKTFNEHDAFPDAGYQAVQRAAVSWTNLVGTMKITGSARAALKNSGYGDHVALESDGLQADLVDLATTTALTGSTGLLTAVDSTSAYAGVTRGGDWFDSSETAVNADLSFDAMSTMYFDMIDAEIAAKPDIVITSPTQGQKHYNISGQPGMKMFAPGDPASQMSNQMFNGVPVLMMPDLTSSVLLMLDRTGRNFEFKAHRMLEVYFRGRSGDSDVYDMIMAYAFVCRNPKKQGKLTGLTT
jgi:hypothetical protein